MPTTIRPPLRQRGPLLLIGLLFLGPFLAAYAWYFYYPQWRVVGRTNYGQLIEPARPLAEFSGETMAGVAVNAQVFKGHWTLLYVGTESCADACMHSLYLTRQVRTRLARDRDRVQRVYIAPDAQALSALASSSGEFSAGQSSPAQSITGQSSPGQSITGVSSSGASSYGASSAGTEHEDLLRFYDTGTAGHRLRDFVGPVEGGWYLLDPNGNWVLWYPETFEPAGLYKDFRQLLKLSQIG